MGKMESKKSHPICKSCRKYGKEKCLGMKIAMGIITVEDNKMKIFINKDCYELMEED